MGYAFLLEQEVDSQSCGQCGIVFWVDANWLQAKRDKLGTFYCPNGHRRVFLGKSTEQRLQEAEERIAAERQRRERAERQVIAAKGQVTKIKNRVSAGVCPCCNRTFQNLSRHMAGQHPDWKSQEVG